MLCACSMQGFWKSTQSFSPNSLLYTTHCPQSAWACIQVFREVAVLDKINPGGFYSSRIKLLGSFQHLATRTVAAADPDIPDPLYGELEEAALPDCIATLRQACRGLLAHLLQLQAR